MDRKDILLVVVASGNGTPLTPVQLQKSLFLISENLKGEIPDPFYDFGPYHYGPVRCRSLWRCRFLELEGLLFLWVPLKGRG